MAARTPGTAARRSVSDALTRGRSPRMTSPVAADALVAGDHGGRAGVALDGGVGAQRGLEEHAAGHDEHGGSGEGQERPGERAGAGPGGQQRDPEHGSVPQVRQALGDFVGGGAIQRPGDAAVGQQDHPVGVASPRRDRG